MFNANDKEILLYGFNEYCVEKEQFQTRTSASYTRLMEVFFDNVVINKIPRNNYVELFSEANLLKTKDIIKNNAIRATFLSFLNFLKEEGFLEVDVDYYEIKERIGIIFTGENRNTENNIEVLTPRELKNLFYGMIFYKTEEERILTPLISALSFFCMFKQSDIFKLKLDDVNIEAQTIKNTKYHESVNMAEYIKMNEKFYTIMKDYLEYRNQLNVESDALIIYQNKPIDMTGLNGLLGVYKRANNRASVNAKSINCELLIRTMMHYQLNTKGECNRQAVFYTYR